MLHRTGVIELDAVENEIVRAGIGYWRRLKGGRAFPSRRQVLPRELAGLGRNFALVAVLDNGQDYAFRIWGQAHVEAAGFNMQGSQIRDLQRISPPLAEAWPRLYARVVETGLPFALRSLRDMPRTGTIASENVLLPVGKGGTVDHIMVFSAYQQVDLPREPILG